MNKVLLDSSFLFALADPDDKRRVAALNFMEHNTSVRVIPDVVLPEVTYLITRFIHYRAMMNFLAAITASDAELQQVEKRDLRRAHEIMVAYADAQFDLVDCCIMALSERLNITQVCTFDRRDFSIFRPAHCDYLELLP